MSKDPGGPLMTEKQKRLHKPSHNQVIILWFLKSLTDISWFIYSCAWEYHSSNSSDVKLFFFFCFVLSIQEILALTEISTRDNLSLMLISLIIHFEECITQLSWVTQQTSTTNYLKISPKILNFEDFCWNWWFFTINTMVVEKNVFWTSGGKVYLNEFC